MISPQDPFCPSTYYLLFRSSLESCVNDAAACDPTAGPELVLLCVSGPTFSIHALVNEDSGEDKVWLHAFSTPGFPSVLLVTQGSAEFPPTSAHEFQLLPICAVDSFEDYFLLLLSIVMIFFIYSSCSWDRQIPFSYIWIFGAVVMHRMWFHAPWQNPYLLQLSMLLLHVWLCVGCSQPTNLIILTDQ